MIGEHLHPVQRPGRSIGKVTRAESVAGALALLADGTRRPVAGGTDLILDIERGGPGEPVDLVDLSSIADGSFDRIVEDGDTIRIGGGVTHNQVVASALVFDNALPLAQACVEIGSPQLRNRATLAGNLATASPANDSISALMALDATLELTSASDGAMSARQVAVADFFPGFRSTVLQPGELITTIIVPKLGADQRGIWVKLGLRKAQAISVVHAGIVVGLDTDDTVTHARLGIGSVAPTVVVVPDFANALLGRTLNAETIEQAGTATAAAVKPIDDGRATGDYRSQSVATLIRRSLEALLTGRQGEMWLADPPLLAASPTAGALAVSADSGDTLLDHLRSTGLDGVKEGCAEGECGACTVHLDGVAVMSCLVPAASADGANVTTIEALARDGSLAPIQQAFIDEFAVQCGFCIPGFVVAAAALLDENPDPNDEQIKLALSGNLCRCTGYYPIVQAVKRAAEMRRSQ